jgi:hypothetical protein
MSASETLQTVILAIEANDFAQARSYLTDEFTFGGAVPQPIGPDAWLSIHKAINAAMPDYSFNARGIHDENGGAVGQMQITGTQTNDLTLPLPGIPAIAPTGKRVSLPTENLKVTARGDKLASIAVSEVPGGGVPGALAQLGVTIPGHV